jgi:hypothetical protein
MNRRTSLVVGIVAVLCSVGIQRVPAQQTSPADEGELPPADAMSWALGTSLGIAAVVHEAGTAPQIVADRIELSQNLADALGVELPALPERADEDKAEFGAKIMHFALREIEPLGKQLTERHSARHARLFEIGIKSSLLAFVYVPGDSTGLALADVIDDRSKKCKLPPKLCEPLVAAIRAKQPYDEVKSKLFAMHEAVRKHLMAGK